MTQNTYRARWIIPVSTPPMRDGIISVRDGRIEKVGAASNGPATDLGDAVVIPALVNAHTHLEFSNLTSAIGLAEMPFAEWIKQVVAWRRTRDEGWDRAGGASPHQISAIRAGIEECRQTGTLLIGEIATAFESASCLEHSNVRGVAFWEMLGWSDASIAPAMALSRKFIENRSTAVDQVNRGASPHAPYTVHQQLLREIVRESSHRGFPVAMHLAETDAELQLLASGSGPFAQMLQALDAWEPQALIPHSRPLDYLKILSGAARVLVIHGNYFGHDEIAFLAGQRANMSVVYCPRTHHYFGHPTYPLSQMLAAGVRVALGTDSRASNPDLNLWNEVRFAAQRHAMISPATWLRMATLNGAEALGMDAHYGSLEAGKAAHFLVIPLSADQRNDPWNWIYEDWKPLILTNQH